MIASLRQKIDAASWHEAYLQAHELKGSLGIFKMQLAVELVSRMEVNARTSEHLDEMPGLFSQLQAVVLETQPLLQAELNKMNKVKS
jgi:HPt (histidine-containing phosphotransfer) domain-containing protein